MKCSTNVPNIIEKCDLGLYANRDLVLLETYMNSTLYSENWKRFLEHNEETESIIVVTFQKEI